jgi:hypothetical protein
MEMIWRAKLHMSEYGGFGIVAWTFYRCRKQAEFRTRCLARNLLRSSNRASLRR